VDVDINKSRRNNQIGKIKVLSPCGDFQAAPLAKTLNTSVFNHNYRALNNFCWSEQPGGGDAGLHRECVIVKNRAE
jgi:hypothetical protein